MTTGMCVLYGQSSGPVEPVDPQTLSVNGSIFLTRPTLGHYVATREELDFHVEKVMGAIQRGELVIRIFDTMPMSEAAAAHTLLESRKTSGKLVLVNSWEEEEE